jgi:hypothetical protein
VEESADEAHVRRGRRGRGRLLRVGVRLNAAASGDFWEAGNAFVDTGMSQVSQVFAGVAAEPWECGHVRLASRFGAEVEAILRARDGGGGPILVPSARQGGMDLEEFRTLCGEPPS